jgi:hypothetical protein
MTTKSTVALELTTRLSPSIPRQAMDVATLTGLIRETSEYHDHFEKTHVEHHWWDWYASYLSARQSGSNPEEAAAAADHYMEKVLHVSTR